MENYKYRIEIVKGNRDDDQEDWGVRIGGVHMSWCFSTRQAAEDAARKEVERMKKYSKMK